jgi:hypothetical protein
MTGGDLGVPFRAPRLFRRSGWARQGPQSLVGQLLIEAGEDAPAVVGQSSKAIPLKVVHDSFTSSGGADAIISEGSEATTCSGFSALVSTFGRPSNKSATTGASHTELSAAGGESTVGIMVGQAAVSPAVGASAPGSATPTPTWDPGWSEGLVIMSLTGRGVPVVPTSEHEISSLDRVTIFASSRGPGSSGCVRGESVEVVSGYLVAVIVRGASDKIAYLDPTLGLFP